MKTAADFPRYKYHLDLVHKIVHHGQKKGIPISFRDLESTILVLGRITEEYKNLFKPLTFEKCPCNGKLCNTLIVLFRIINMRRLA